MVFLVKGRPCFFTDLAADKTFSMYFLGHPKKTKVCIFTALIVDLKMSLDMANQDLKLCL